MMLVILGHNSAHREDICYIDGVSKEVGRFDPQF